MSRPVRDFIRHEVAKPINPDGSFSVYCRRCGREIIRQARPVIRSVTACQICIQKEQGVLYPEDHVLNQYQISVDMNRIPIPVNDDGLEQGVLMLYPEEYSEQQGMLPQSGGVVGTVRAIFRAMGFRKPKEVIIAEEPASKGVARSKRSGGLWEEKRKK